jgi:gliding motility-associated-like protein
LAPVTELEYWHYPSISMAACYAVTAVDSVGNESRFSNIICVDDCINFELPNVFTPNGDGMNDLFKPFPYNLVEKIDLKIYGRWGNLVFQTSDPDINWDARHMDSGKKVPSGVYYYVCDVYERRLTGLEPRYLIGFVHILYSDEK